MGIATGTSKAPQLFHTRGIDRSVEREELQSRSALARTGSEPTPPLIIVAHRAPLTLEKGVNPDGSEREVVSLGTGGLVTGLAELASNSDAVWVGAAVGGGDVALAAKAERNGGRVTADGHDESFRVAFVHPTAEQHHMHYNVISNPLLWFLQHYMWDAAHGPTHTSATQEAWTSGYRAVNDLFATEIIDQIHRSPEPPVVLLQDYQLYCIADKVRAACPDALIQQFVHIPWPAAPYWRLIPRYMRQDILNGLLGCDVVGFQTDESRQNFLDTVAREGLGQINNETGEVTTPAGHVVKARCYPISVSVSEFQEAQRSQATQEVVAQLPQTDAKVILRVDRADLSKNIVRGMAAYERLLERHPEMLGKVEHWALVVRTRENVPEYQQYMTDIQESVARVNARFGTPDWTPISLMINPGQAEGRGRNWAIAAYGRADALFVNANFDGMNLVAKEGVICSRPTMVLALSENAGAFPELEKGVVPLDPFDVDQMADGLYLSLTMDPLEARTRHLMMDLQIRHNDIKVWIRDQMKDIVACRGGVSAPKVGAPLPQRPLAPPAPNRGVGG